MADWAGQKRAEAMCVWLTSLFGVVGFLLGYARQDFGMMMKVRGRVAVRVCDWGHSPGGGAAEQHTQSTGIAIPPPTQVYGVGVALAGAATIPDWPWLNRSPLHWLPAEDASGSGDAPTTRRATTQRRLPVIE